MALPIVERTAQLMAFSRERTLGTLSAIEQRPDAHKVLGWRPSPGRAHIAWQMMHIGITEELFATERLRGTTAAFADLVPRFKGGSTPDDSIPSVAEIRDVLAKSREHMLATLSALREHELATIPPALAARGMTVANALDILIWHEAHHQGQAHITLNLYKSTHA